MKNSNQRDTTNSTNSWPGKLHRAAGALSMLLLLGASVSAQSLVGPFSGQYQEGFETSPAIAPGYAPNPVLQGYANYFTGWGSRTNGWGFGCNMQPNTGSWFVGDTGGLTWLDFNTPPARFGGYFGSNQTGGPAIVEVRFLNSSNSVLFTQTRTLPNNCTWIWMGWDLATLNVSRIEFQKTSSPGYMMVDDLQLDTTPVNSCASTFCVTDGSTGVTACPCGNNSTNGGGCANGTGNGATLSMYGSCSTSAADARLLAENLPPNQWALFFEGGSTLPAGGMSFADGMLCVGGPYAGVQFVMADAAGVAGPITDIYYKGLPYMANHMPGNTTYYQCYYHTPGGLSVCGASWNLTNGVKLMWTP